MAAAAWARIRSAASRQSTTACAIFYLTPVIEIQNLRLGRDQDPGLPAAVGTLKEVFTEYNDLSFSYCMQQLAAFRASDEEQILFVHIREPEEIARFRQAAGEGCLHAARAPAGARSARAARQPRG